MRRTETLYAKGRRDAPVAIEVSSFSECGADIVMLTAEEHNFSQKMLEDWARAHYEGSAKAFDAGVGLGVVVRCGD